MKDVVVSQKENRKGNIICYATAGGYDYSFEAQNQETAQLLMSRALHKIGMTAVFEPIEKYIHEPTIGIPPVTYQRHRLDYL